MGHFSCLHGGDAEHRAQTPAPPWAHPRSQPDALSPLRGDFGVFVGLRHICHASINPTQAARTRSWVPFQTCSPSSAAPFLPAHGASLLRPGWLRSDGVQNTNIKHFFNSKFNYTQKKKNPQNPAPNPLPTAPFIVHFPICHPLKSTCLHCALNYFNIC